MSKFTKQIVHLADTIGAHLELTHWAISMRVARKGNFIARLKNDGDCETQTYENVLRRFSDIWPSDLEWPRDIPRPKTKGRTA